MVAQFQRQTSQADGMANQEMKDYDRWKLRSDRDDDWPPEEEWPEDRKEEPPEPEDED